MKHAPDTTQRDHQFVCPLLGRSRWVGIFTALLVGGAWVPFQLFHASPVFVVWVAILGATLVMLYGWLLKTKPEHRLLITATDITLKGPFHATTIAFSEVNDVKVRRTTLLGTNQEIEISRPDGTAILVHEGFTIAEQVHILSLLTARLQELGKVHLVTNRP